MTYKMNEAEFEIQIHQHDLRVLFAVTGEVEITFDDHVCMPIVKMEHLEFGLYNDDGVLEKVDLNELQSGTRSKLESEIYKAAERHGYDEYADYCEGKADEAADHAYDSKNDR